VISRSQPLPVAFAQGCLHILAECGFCERVKPLLGRGLCGTCREERRRDGTIAEFGYVKADRVADFARYRLGGVGVAGAAGRVGVSLRTGWRYEAELAGSGRAPWREWPCAA
jgi:hypothetical protein